MATSTQINALTALYVGYFDRAPDPAGLQFWIEQIDGGREFNTIAADFAASAEAEALYPYLTTPDVSTPSTFVQNIYLNLFGRTAEPAGLEFWTGVLEDGSVSVADMIEAIINGAVDDAAATPPSFDKSVLDNKVEVGLDWVQSAASVPGFEFDAAAKAAAVASVNGVTEDEATVEAAKAATDAFVGGAANPGDTFTLTTGFDSLTGTAGKDTFLSGETAGNVTLTVGDSIDGGAGVDTLKVVENGAFNGFPTGITLKNVENVEVVSGATVTADTTQAGITGVTSLSTTSKGGATVTGAATTDLNVTESAVTAANGNVTVNGGNNVTVAVSGTANEDGGGAGDADAEIVVGATAAAKGDVTVTSTHKGADGNEAADIAVTGGKTVTVTQSTTNAVNTTNTQGNVTVTGSADTTAVTVNQDKAATKSATVAGKVNGAVKVTDVNAASGTDAGTIATVSLNSYGNSTIDSSALTTVNLSGTGGTLGISRGALTATPTANDLALNVSGLTAAAITDAEAAADDGFKTINLNATGEASTIADLIAADATALNISGDAKVTLTAQTLANTKTITVTNTAGASLGTALANDVVFTGGTGADAVTLGATTKTIDMGAGDDTVTLNNATLGAGGSVKGGEGTDTVVANTSGSSFSADPAVDGFETLRVDGAAAQGTHNANGFTALELGGINAAGMKFTNVAAGVGLTIDETTGAASEVELANATGTSDSFTLTLASKAAINANTVTLDGIETVNIVSDDTETGATATAHVNTLALASDKAKSVVVTGDAGLNIDATNASAITSFDASGVVLGKVTDTGVTFTSTNSTVAEIVNIKGSNGVDTLSGSATANDVIDGGAGADTIIYTGGSDSFTGGAGNDTFDLNATGTKAAHAEIMDIAASDKIDFADVSDADGDIADGALGAKITLGAAATLQMYLDEAAKDTTDVAAGGNGELDVALANWFQFGGDTYIVIDNEADATFQDGEDGLVKIAGTVDLSDSTLTSEVLTFV